MPAIRKTLLIALMTSFLFVSACSGEVAAMPDGFVYADDVIPDAVLDIRYAGEHNFVGGVIDGYEAPRAILTREAASALARAADVFREKGYRIKIFDAYRPQSAVRHFLRWANDADDTRMRDEFYPDYQRKILLVDQGYIARNSAHTRGSAVDLTLTDIDGNELDMGGCFDFFGKRSWYEYAGATDAQKENRALLRDVMTRCGFRPFDKEWWHFRLMNEPYPDTSFDFPVK